MAECRRGRDRGRGRVKGSARHLERRKKMAVHGHSTFEISEDGAEFVFPTWQDTPKEPSLITRFNTSLKWIGGYSEDEETNFCNEKSYMNFMNMQYYPSQSSRELKEDTWPVQTDYEASFLSRNHKGVILDETHSIIYLCDPVTTQVKLNLNFVENLEPYTGSPKQDFDNLLTWILSNEDVFTQALNLDKETDGNGGKFVSMRNVISEICIKYNNKQENSFLATSFHGVIYLFKIKENFDAGRIHEWAHVFEQIITHNQHDHDKVICNSKYRIVMLSCLGEHRMIFSGGTDCFNPDKYTEAMQDTSALISLKCSYDSPENYKTMKLERYKMFNWCLGLYLSGAPELVVGYRDQGGTVDLLKLYDKSDLMAKGQGYWDMDCVFAFLRHLLSFVKERTESKPGAIFQFVKKDHSKIYNCSEQGEEGEEIIPKWFRNEYKSVSVPRG